VLIGRGEHDKISDAYPPVPVPPAKSKIWHGLGGTRRFIEDCNRSVISARIMRADRPLIPPPSANGALVGIKKEIDSTHTYR
jgi:hypothetical protein